MLRMSLRFPETNNLRGVPQAYKGDKDILMNNLKENCISEPIFDINLDDCDTYLRARRVLIAKKIETYYQ